MQAVSPVKVLVLGGLLTASFGAYGQSAPSGAAANGEPLEEVTVTGSRVITNGNDSPTPVTVLSLDQLSEANPVSVTQALTMMPSIIGTPNQGGQSATNFQAVLNLRGMGGARNLVQFDGHRVLSTTVQGGIDTGVDSNLIPTMLLKRVDVVTGGASAVYGSDAVSGVINYVMDNTFTGVKVNVQGSETTYNDDKQTQFGIAGGTNLFGGRGHVEFSAQRNNDPGLPNRLSREFGQQVWSMQGSVPGSAIAAGTVNNPYNLVQNSRFALTNYNGVISSGPLANTQFAQNGVLSPFVHGALTGSSTTESGGDGGYYSSYPAIGAQTQNLGFGRFDFDLRDNIKFYAEIVAGTVSNYNPTFNEEVRTKAVGYNNAFLASVQQPYQATIQAQKTANPLATFNYSQLFATSEFGPQTNAAFGRQYLYLTGLDGSWGKYKWSVSYEHDDSSLLDSDPYNLSNSRLFAAMNAVVNPATGQPACNAALVNPSVYGGCVPLNLFGPTASNPAAFAYAQVYTYFKVKNQMDDGSVDIVGSPVSTWAGPVTMALSADWRRQVYGIASNAQSTDPVNCTGIQFNCTTSTTPYNAPITNTFPDSAVTVGEAAYETEVPLLADLPLAKSLKFNGAARFTDYSVSGSVWTWKVGFVWTPIDSLTVRAARSHDIRAPNQQQLFSPVTCNKTVYTDIHANNSAGTVNNCSQGNLGLVPEKSDTYTVGVVWTPHFLEGLSASFDAYHISLTDALNSLSPTQPASQAACEASNGTSPICALYIRPFPFSNRTSQNYPTEVESVTLNVGGIFTEGVDSEIDYVHPIAGHSFIARLLTNYQPELTYDLGPGGVFWAAGTADSGVAGLLDLPNLKSSLQLNYEVISGLTATVQERYRNALRQNGSPLLFFSAGKVPPAEYTDLNFSYKLSPAGGALEVFLNIKNLFNTQPAPFAATGANAQIGAAGGYVLGDDILGRNYTLGFKYKIL